MGPRMETAIKGPKRNFSETDYNACLHVDGEIGWRLLLRFL